MPRPSAPVLKLWGEITDALGPEGSAREVGFGASWDLRDGPRVVARFGAAVFSIRPSVACELADHVAGSVRRACTTADARRLASAISSGLRASAADARRGLVAQQSAYAACRGAAGSA
jgi:hypothetical protein